VNSVLTVTPFERMFEHMPAFLARRYATAVDVERRDDLPSVVGWRGRRYVVREVLDHWWETAAWWATETALGDDERECWRVEAVAGQRAPVVLELCFRWSTGQWTVTAVGD
jgi:hypothetical protein